MDTLIAMKCDFSFIYEILNLLHVRYFNDSLMIKEINTIHKKEKIHSHIKYLESKGLIRVFYTCGPSREREASALETAVIKLTPAGHEVRQAMASAELTIKRGDAQTR